MEQLNQLRETLPDAARDIKINLSNVLQPGPLNADQTWGVAIACAYTARNEKLTKALLADAKAAGISDGVLDDAKAAAILMGMNNVYYRFRHVIGKEDYAQMPARQCTRSNVPSAKGRRVASPRSTMSSGWLTRHARSCGAERSTPTR